MDTAALLELIFTQYSSMTSIFHRSFAITVQSYTAVNIECTSLVLIYTLQLEIVSISLMLTKRYNAVDFSTLLPQSLVLEILFRCAHQLFKTTLAITAVV